MKGQKNQGYHKMYMKGWEVETTNACGFPWTWLALFFENHSSTTPTSVFMAMGASTGGSQYLFELQRQLSY
jgi:hypothetical protein